MKNKTAKSPIEPQVHGDTIENPTVNIGSTTIAEDAVEIAIKPREYRTVKANLKLFSMQLKNAEVGYIGNETIKILSPAGEKFS